MKTVDGDLLPVNVASSLLVVKSYQTRPSGSDLQPMTSSRHISHQINHFLIPTFDEKAMVFSVSATMAFLVEQKCALYWILPLVYLAACSNPLPAENQCQYTFWVYLFNLHGNMLSDEGCLLGDLFIHNENTISGRPASSRVRTTCFVVQNRLLDVTINVLTSIDAMISN